MKNNRLFVLKPIALLLSTGFLLLGCQPADETKTQASIAKTAPNMATNIDIWPKLDIAVKQDDAIETKVNTLLGTMTLEQKIAQMIQPEIRDITVEDMRKYGFGSYLNGGGAFPNNNKHATAQDWIALADALYQASIDDSLDGSTIPTMWGTDAVHGHNNVIGATLFPHNIGLGAANNPALIEKIAEVTATEVMVTGIDWVFAPTVAVVRDDRWGRTYEGYSEDPAIVREYAKAIVNGLQGHAKGDFLSDKRVISTVKHFIGDGGTQGGDDQGDNIADEQTLFDIHAQGYVGGLSAGAQSVMASFNSWHGKKNHGNEYLLTQVLKNKMGFDGFVVGDWNGHGQVAGCSNESCPQAINAGLDIFMVPTTAWKPLLENTIAQVKSGQIAQSRVDDAVRRILRVKFRAGLFDKPSPAKRMYSGKTELIGSAAHREIAKQAVRESLVLLKNNQQLLPLNPKQHILLAGDGADNIGKQSGGWTISWQGTGNTNDDFPGGSSIYDGFKQQIEQAGGRLELSVSGDYEVRPDVAVVVFGEEPYAEGNGDLDNLEYQRGLKSDLALLKRLKVAGIPVVSVFISGRPMWVNAELNASDAFVAAWLLGSEGDAVADVLLQSAQGEIQHDFKGKLSFSWPNDAMQTAVNQGDGQTPLLPFGFGLRYGDKSTLANDLNEKSQHTANQIQELVLFERAVKAPWRMSLVDQQGMTAVASSIEQNSALKIKSIDVDIQEDARLVQFNGTQAGALEINDNFPFDLRGLDEASSALVMTVKVPAAVASPVALSMRCENQCDVAIEISQALNSIVGTEWHDVSVDLACFKQQGATMDKIYAPFMFKASQAMAFEFKRIAVVPNLGSQATISCH
ncbi:exo 1,3/1,4-beta-D-glucan glucohydrolase [Pseudoalteromonas tunicata]|uniref:glycoside hydrolase family 3 protein n=1 Tax=Pseudoalteromonas tunicata TaxID=314281 RepID=UPI0027400616|nr:exo 1,3/1,4-beta-D-glucan glucohydrolase [Pseudoalteromonas tunicata]MDP5212665.1 exo 1,3/1,4-beta-D-glucan glucohydrolase [Pseudoalteromonas tunicata]